MGLVSFTPYGEVFNTRYLKSFGELCHTVSSIELKEVTVPAYKFTFNIQIDDHTQVIEWDIYRHNNPDYIDTELTQIIRAMQEFRLKYIEEFIRWDRIKDGYQADMSGIFRRVCDGMVRYNTNNKEIKNLLVNYNIKYGNS